MYTTIVERIREKSCKWWYKHQIWHDDSQWCTKETELMGHSKIQDGGHFLRWPPNSPPKIVKGIKKHRANHDTSIKFGRVVPKIVQKKLNRLATQKYKITAILKMATKLTSQNSGGKKETSCKSWYKHPILQGDFQCCTKETESIGHSKIQDGGDLKDGSQTHLPKEW